MTETEGAERMRKQCSWIKDDGKTCELHALDVMSDGTLDRPVCYEHLISGGRVGWAVLEHISSDYDEQ